MRTLRRVWARLLGALGLRSEERLLQEELESHIAMQTEDNIRRGMTAEEARRVAMIQFGGVEATKDLYRDQRGLPFFDALKQDLRYTFRGLRRSLGFTTVAVLSLGIGIGGNTAIFSVVRGVLLRPLAYEDPSRLFAIREVVNNVPGNIPANPLHVREWRKECPSLEGIAAARLFGYVLLSGGEAEQIPGVQTEPDLFAVLDVQPRLGRVFLPEEAQIGQNHVVMITESLWQRRFAASESVIGQSISLGGESYKIVGVLPAHFRLPFGGGMEVYSNLFREPEIYQPLAISSQELRPMGNFNYSAIARLKPGATPERARAEIDAVQARFPAMVGERVSLKAALVPLQDVFVGRVRLGLWTMLAAVAAVLLIVCVNLANLLIARMTARLREAAIRVALGASRGRLLRQMLTESVTLSALGGALGVALAAIALKLLLSAASTDLPRLDQVRLDGSVLAFSLAITLATGIFSGLLPGWILMRRDPQDALKSGSHTVTAAAGALRARHALITLEVALSAALLIVAGLLTSSFVRILRVEKGFETSRILTINVALMNTRYQKEEARERFFRETLAKLAAAPGVQSAAMITALPSRGETWIDPVSVEGDTRPIFERPMPNNRRVSPGYFRTLGIPMLRGREFEEADRNREVGVISAKLAERLWPGENALGRRFSDGTKLRTVIGVAADVRTTLTKEPVMIVYYPYWVGAPFSGWLTVKTDGDPMAVASGLRAAVREQDSEIPVRQIQTMDEVVSSTMDQRRFQLIVVLLFAASALLVATLGIYGVVSFAVACRRTELGVRTALGARPADLFLLVLRQGMAPVALGLIAGTAGALALGSVISSLLFGVRPADPITIAVVLALLGGAGLLACLLPARAAAASDPARVLRFE